MSPAHHNTEPEHLAADDGLTALGQLQTVSCTVLFQALNLLSTSITSDAQMTYNSTSIPGSTIGKHLRHAYAHFDLLLEAMQGERPWIVNYDVRQRQSPIESSVRAAKEAIEGLILKLTHLRDDVNADIHIDDPVILNAVTPDRQIFQSTFGRELWFAALHAVHHWSMIRLIASEQFVHVEESFGISPSTLVYRGSNAPLAKARI
ncbi:hypothetical protein SISNIDRAFT_485539 [Sistotremastrum niveocremeum HHB9708]|uniref:DinB-like domain-containing protein n=2 Tax=Sistotremastraceae TaxID=3402574 RepID=A0A164UIN2_9AGAM|nr:hypothetical protein SISNIDRAFT_485539 [Sistotremastrum niveocremeum HHB9708]KZT43935.1 hypothetical protein SISSUDRAFT_977890 [Sistotremastrum suecicum HHB10207 ss-3]